MAKAPATKPRLPRRRPQVVPPQGGRPSRIHDETLRARFVDLIRVGTFKDAAARSVRVPRRTVDSWLARGKASCVAVFDAWEAIEAGTPDVVAPEPDQPYHDFYLDFEDADAQAEMRAIAQVQEHVRGGRLNGHFLDPSEQMLRWFMERRWPDRWGAPTSSRLTIAGDADAPLSIRSERIDLWSPAERLAAVIEARAEAGDKQARAIMAAGAIDTTATEDPR
jgi:hypothetical protein